MSCKYFKDKFDSLFLFNLHAIFFLLFIYNLMAFNLICHCLHTVYNIYCLFEAREMMCKKENKEAFFIFYF